MPPTSTIEQLYQEYAGDLLAYFSRRCRVDAAHDLLHETFLQVLRHGRLNTVDMPRAWLFGIARNTLSRHYRQQPRDFVLPATAGEDHAKPDVALSRDNVTSDGADARLEAMHQAIAGLAPELRETLELRLEQELSYEEIANVLAVPLGTVRSRLHTAVQRLREALKTTGNQS